MKKIPTVSEAEWEVMKVIWDNSPITANEVVELLAPHTDWNPRTIKTMLNRLLKKGALSYQYKSTGKKYLYYPRITKESCIKREGQHFLNRFFEGAALPMLAHFTKELKLSEEEIEELRNILDNKES